MVVTSKVKNQEEARLKKKSFTNGDVDKMGP